MERGGRGEKREREWEGEEKEGGKRKEERNEGEEEGREGEEERCQAHSGLHVHVIKSSSIQFPDAGGAAYQTLQNNLSAASASLNVVSSEVVAAARGTPEQQAEATSKFAHCFEELLTAGLTLAGASKVCV